MSRWIEIDTALLKTVSVGGLSAKALWKRIMQQPSIDIVFCKECKWFRKAPNTEHDYDNSCGVWASICEEDGFCNYGERREP